MSASLRGRASQVLLCGALIVTAVSGRGTAIVDAQAPPLRWDGLIEHVTAGASAPQPDGPSRLSRHSVTRDGRYLVFDSDATNLGPWGEPSAIYRRDRMTGQTERLFGMTGSEPVISADGHHMAFVHCGGWFRPDMSAICDVYVVDLRNWSIVIASWGLDGTYSDGPSSQPVLSGDGRFVLFRTTAPNLIPAGASGHQIMVRDRDADQNGLFDEPEPGAVTLETVSLSSANAPANQPSESAEISDDGQFIAFRSLASNLVAGDTNAHWDVFLRDRAAGETRRINVGWDGQEATPTADSPDISMSADGRFVAFASDDWYMVPQWTHQEDTNNKLDVFVYDRLEDSRTRIDLGVDGEPGSGATFSPMLTEDGRHVLVVTSSTNVGEPSATGQPQVFVHDRLTFITQRVSYKPDWTESNAAWERPVISRDGSLIVFSSRATDLAEHVTNGIDAIYAASHFDASPPTLTIGGHGGRVTAHITAQAYTPWWVSLEGNGWLTYDSPPFGNGSGTVAFLASGANPDATPRSATVVINAKTVTIIQQPGLTLATISPDSGPVSSGNEVTIRGTGFLNGTIAYFDGVPATRTEFVNATTLRADPPAHAPGVVHLYVMSPDGRYAMLPAAYRYLDNTPPQITPYLEGTLGNDGWYTSDVSISWLVRDDDSPESIGWGAGCALSWLRTDSEGTTFTCAASSEGGSASASVTVKRDTRPPFVSMSTPQDTLYRVNQAVNASYSCFDSTPGSRMASCVGTVPLNSSISTTTPGRSEFAVTGTDRAGLTGSGLRRYAVGYSTCQAWPQGIAAWWPGDNDYRDAAGGHTGTMINPIVQGTPFSQGIQGQAIFTHSANQRYLQIGDTPDLRFTDSVTLASWIWVLGASNPVNVIAGREGEYMLGYGPDARLRYAIQTTDHAWQWVNTGVAVSANIWTHVAMTYDGASVNIYVNGVRAFTRAATGPIGDALPDLNDFRIGARQLAAEPSYFTGHFDNVMVLGRPMSDSEVEGLFLSGVAGLCPKETTVRIVPNPSVKTYGADWVEVVAELTGPNGPIAGRNLSFFYGTQTIGGGQTTDANGIARHWIYVGPTQNPGTYPNVIHVRHTLTSDLQAFEAHGDLLVAKATPVIAWNTPAAITHGTALSSTQLNAIANANGSYTYTPGWGTVLPAGDHTLSLLFQPSDPTRYTSATASVTINVRRAAPTIAVSGGTFTYDGQPHSATGAVTGVGEAALGTPTFTYNGGAAPPLTVGAYEVVATYPGSANYGPASATTAIAILKATPILDWTVPQAIVYGTPLGAAQLNATANVAGTFTYSPAAGTVLNVGPAQVLTAAFTSADPNYSGDGIVNTLIDVSKAAPVLTWPQPAAIAYGTALGSTQLNATSNVPGTFTYSPAAGTLPNAGASQTLTATFTPADSANYNGGSVTAAINVSKATATVTTTGGTFTYDGQPHPATGAVTGLNAASIGTPSFTYNGSAVPPVHAGSYAVVASFAGDPNYEPSSATATITIGKAPAVVAWNQPAAIVYGTPLGVAQLNASSNVAGTFAYSPAAGTVLPAGTPQVLTATFSPSDAANYVGASVGTSIGVVAAPLSIRANDSAKPFGAPLPVFTASAAGFVNGDSFVSLSGAPSFATTATAQSAVGTYPVTVSGLGSPNYAITFVSGALGVVRGGVTVSVTTSPAPSGLNQPMTFTAHVIAAAPAAGTPGGTVRFFDGATLLGSGTLSGGSVSFTTAGLTAGVHAIEARYDGDASFETGSRPASHTVNSAAATPSITIASNRNPSSVGQSVTLTATLGMSAGPISGTVQFYDGATLLGTSTIVSGSATFTTTAFAAGSHAVTVRYLGSASAPPAISGVFVQAVGSSGWKNRTSSATLSASPNPSLLGATVTLTANITGSSGTPAGAVLFMVNGQVVGGPVTLTPVSGSTARATVALPGLPGGRHTVSATYLGSSNYKGSTATVTQTVN